MNRRKSILLSTILMIVLLFGLVGCQSVDTPADPATSEEPVVVDEPVEASDAVEQPESEEPVAPAEVKDFVTWYPYDQNNEDPVSDERVGNEWLRKTIPEFNADFEGKWNWVNVHKPFDKIFTELVTATIAGGEIPDLFEVGSGNLPIMLKNGAIMDITEWVEAQSWYADMDPNAMELCRVDGRIYCVPFAQRPSLTYVWADYFPNGYPTTPDEFMVEAERLKSEGVYAWTYFGSTAYGGNGVTRMVYSLISSFGGSYDDGNGNMLLNTPENVAAIEFFRETVAKGYNPDTVFAGGFVEEDSFKDASAASIPTGLFGYRYINPLTAPDGTKYETGSAQDMLDAIAAGDVIMAPMFAPPGKKPGCNTEVASLAITSGANNVEAAYDFINWLMEPERDAEYVFGPGAGFPVNKQAQSDPLFQTPFYLQAAGAIEKSACTPWFGSFDRAEEAAEMIMITIYNLVKEDPTLDIATELQKTQDEYNANN